MNSTRIPPPPHLKNYIRFFWSLEFTHISKCDSLFKVFARKYPRLVFQHYNGSPAIFNNSGYLPTAYLSGLNTVPYDCGIHPSVSAFGVSFYPHAVRPIFGIDVSDIVNELPGLNNFVRSYLNHRMMEAKTVSEKVEIISDFFTKRLANADLSDRSAEMGWKMIMQETDDTKVKDLVKVFHVSERQLQRQFKQNLGFSPQQYLNINRFEKSLEVLQSGESKTLLEVAYKLGYADQSHFIREFKQFSGQTPGQYLKLDKIYDESSAFILKQTSTIQKKPELKVGFHTVPEYSHA